MSVGDFFALGSGPARAQALKPAETYEEIGYKDEADLAILTLEADTLPGVEVTEAIARIVVWNLKMFNLLVAPTSSLVGSITDIGKGGGEWYLQNVGSASFLM